MSDVHNFLQCGVCGEAATLESLAGHPCMAGAQQIYVSDDGVAMPLVETSDIASPVASPGPSIPSPVVSPGPSTSKAAAEICENQKGLDKFQWSHEHILMLLMAYEMRKGEMADPQKKKKFWINLAKDLELNGLEVSPDQARWKFNYLLRGYKEVKDNANKTGRGAAHFKYESRMDDIFGNTRRKINAQHVLNSALPVPATTQSSPNEEIPSELSGSKSDDGHSESARQEKKRRPLKSSRREIELMWTEQLKARRERDEAKKLEIPKKMEVETMKEENKKRKLELMEREQELKERYLNRKIEELALRRREKGEQYREQVMLEREKIRAIQSLRDVLRNP